MPLHVEPRGSKWHRARNNLSPHLLAHVAMPCSCGLTALCSFTQVHERNVDSDFLLIILRDLLHRRPSLRVILMSATMNADLFADYFTLTSSSSVRAPPGLGGGGGCARDVPVIHIPGYTYPVRVHWLADAVEYTGCSSEALQTKSSGRGRAPDPKLLLWVLAGGLV
jgi:hypothetical protein